MKSTDGGATWAPLEAATAKGLPPKPWGRVAVTTAPSNPRVVYALIEAVPPYNGLYRSDDGGKTWELRDRSRFMVWRPFYFANLIVDPKNENRLYKPDLTLIVSSDGGSSFSTIGGGAHGDFHDVWVDPEDTDHLICGDDGGVWYSYDAGNKWWKAENLPISQFYHVSLDMDDPYHVYGGLQDNSSWVGDSGYPGGIGNNRWENMYGGDGFWMFPDPTDPDYLYAEAQGGEIGRVNRKTHETRPIKPMPGYHEGKLRFNWNTPIHVSPTRKGTIYLGAQFLFRSSDFGQTWDRISPDLTTNDPLKQKQELSGGVTVDNSAAETHTTIYAICESPKDPDLIWVGHGRRQPAAHARRRQDVDERGDEHSRPAEERVGLLARRRATSTTAPCTPRSTCTRSATCVPTSTARTTSARHGPRSSLRESGATAMRTWSRKISSTRICCSSARSSGCGSRSTAEGSGRSTRAATCRTSRCAISPSSRATTISSSPRTAAGSGSSTTSRRCAR